MADFCLNSLMIWFEGLIPALFPFLFLSNLLVLSHRTNVLTCLFDPLLRLILRTGRDMNYVVIAGFLFGFPMGAKTIGQLYAQGQLTRDEASYLLAYCNHLSPVFILTFILPTLHLTNGKEISTMLFLLYGIPFLYGILLRHTFYRHKINLPGKRTSSISSVVIRQSIFEVLDLALCDALMSLARIGGYMLLGSFAGFFVCRFCTILGHSGAFLLLYPFIEISAGIRSKLPVSVTLAAITLGGISCVFQTRSMLFHTDLNIRHYLFHKCVQCTIILTVYFLLKKLHLI